MILPIYTYGNPVLRQQSTPIDESYPEIQELINNMFETMYNAEGVGFAAPQVGIPIRLIVIDANELSENHPECKEFKRVLINPEITEHSSQTITLEEGCLSFPGIHEKVARAATIQIEYLDENFIKRQETLSGFAARVVQHEYDHLKGQLFIDTISPIRRQLNKGKLTNLIKGKTSCKYQVKTAK
jgi:peptide deformylase